MIYMDGRTPSFVTLDGVSAAGSILHNAYNACPDLCMCSSTGSCYVVIPTSTSKNPEIVMYPHCDSNGVCFFAAFISTPGAMKPYDNVGQSYTDALQYDTNGARLPITDPSYVRVASVSCKGCPITIE
uniref:Uncharacterized protein n=1 Tax=Panagrolaimus davidi TaxID=227884 RepID=A0A914QRL9_9BILA